MKIMFTLCILVLSIACEAPKKEKITETNPLRSSEKVLIKVTFSNAIHRYGEPQAEEKIKLNAAPKHIQEAAATYTANVDSTKVLHVLWNKLAQHPISVWYIFKENQWKPLHVSI